MSGWYDLMFVPKEEIILKIREYETHKFLEKKRGVENGKIKSNQGRITEFISEGNV